MQRASFAGIELDVFSVEDPLTKRIAEYRYPYRDGSTLEDMGREPRMTRLECAFFNSPEEGEYESRLADLIAMFETGETDLFVHPTLGEWQAKVRSLTIGHSDQAKNFVSVSIEMIEDGVDVPLALVETESIESLQGTAFEYCDSIRAATLAFTDDMTSIIDAVDAIETFAEDVQDFSNDLTRQINFVRSKIDKAIASIEKIKDIEKWPIIKPMKQAAEYVNRLADRVRTKKPRVRKQDIKVTVPLSLLCLKMYGPNVNADEKVAELLEINQIRNPYLIEPGTELQAHGT